MEKASTMKNLVELRGVDKEFAKNGKQEKVLSGINFDMKEGEFISILGKSGCGKSTLLRLLEGLDTPTSGTISIGGGQKNGIDSSYYEKIILSHIMKENETAKDYSI